MLGVIKMDVMRILTIVTVGFLVYVEAQDKLRVIQFFKGGTCFGGHDLKIFKKIKFGQNDK